MPPVITVGYYLIIIVNKQAVDSLFILSKIIKNE